MLPLVPPRRTWRRVSTKARVSSKVEGHAGLLTSTPTLSSLSLYLLLFLFSPFLSLGPLVSLSSPSPSIIAQSSAASVYLRLFTPGLALPYLQLYRNRSAVEPHARAGSHRHTYTPMHTHTGQRPHVEVMINGAGLAARELIQGFLSRSAGHTRSDKDILWDAG